MAAGPAPVVIAVKRVRAASAPLPLPAYQTDGAAGMDLLADVAADHRNGLGHVVFLR